MWPMPVRVDKWFAKHIRPAGECWEWVGARTMNGYGQLKIAGKSSMAHRALYEYFITDIPAGLDLDHLCRNRACVNPWHLEPVTRSTNLFRAANLGRHNTLKTECPQRHPYDEANTRITVKGGRACRACERERAAEKRRQKVDASCG
jgi:hypothetical protein